MPAPREQRALARHIEAPSSPLSPLSASIGPLLKAFAGREAWVLAGLVLLLNLADLLLTQRYVPALARELNPLMSWALDRGLFVPVKLVLTLVATLTIAGFHLRRTGWTALGISGATVGWNLGQLLVFLG